MRGRAALRLPLAGGGNPCACRICELASSESRAPHCDCVFGGPSRFRSAFDRRVHPGIGCFNPARSIRSASSLPHVRPTKTVLTLPTAPKIIASFDRSNSASQFA